MIKVPRTRVETSKIKETKEDESASRLGTTEGLLLSYLGRRKKDGRLFFGVRRKGRRDNRTTLLGGGEVVRMSLKRLRDIYRKERISFLSGARRAAAPAIMFQRGTFGKLIPPTDRVFNYLSDPRRTEEDEEKNGVTSFSFAKQGRSIGRGVFVPSPNGSPFFPARIGRREGARK